MEIKIINLDDAITEFIAEFYEERKYYILVKPLILNAYILFINLITLILYRIMNLLMLGNLLCLIVYLVLLRYLLLLRNLVLLRLLMLLKIVEIWVY